MKLNRNDLYSVGNGKFGYFYANLPESATDAIFIVNGEHVQVVLADVKRTGDFSVRIQRWGYGKLTDRQSWNIIVPFDSVAVGDVLHSHDSGRNYQVLELDTKVSEENCEPFGKLTKVDVSAFTDGAVIVDG